MNCNLCPRNCNINRDNSIGYCGANNIVKIAKYALFGYEEPCISGAGGSGAIFFSGCSLKCVFCQNYEVSHNSYGREISVQELADIFRELENSGADNINLITPTQYVNQIIQALKIYRPNIPIVYNTHGYEKIETIEKLAPYIDVFLPDFKYFTEESAIKYSKAKDYTFVCKNAIKKMVELKPDIYKDGMIKQGVIIRHMIMPLLTDESINILDYIKQNFPQTKVSLMAQYTPYGKASEYKEINRRITKREYIKVVNHYIDLDLDGYIQDMESAKELYIPSWD